MTPGWRTGRNPSMCGNQGGIIRFLRQQKCHNYQISEDTAKKFNSLIGILLLCVKAAMAPICASWRRMRKIQDIKHGEAQRHRSAGTVNLNHSACSHSVCRSRWISFLSDNKSCRSSANLRGCSSLLRRRFPNNCARWYHSDGVQRAQPWAYIIQPVHALSDQPRYSPQWAAFLSLFLLSPTHFQKIAACWRISCEVHVDSTNSTVVLV